MEEKRLALEMVLHNQDDHPEKAAQNRLISPQNGPLHSTTAWETPLLNTHLKSCDSPATMEEERPSLETPT